MQLIISISKMRGIYIADLPRFHVSLPASFNHLISSLLTNIPTWDGGALWVWANSELGVLPSDSMPKMHYLYSI